MRISDWSSDVCSSDLADHLARIARLEIGDGSLDLRRLARRAIDARAAGGEIALDDHLADAARAAGNVGVAAVEAEHVVEVHKILLSTPSPSGVGWGGACCRPSPLRLDSHL